MADSGLCFLTRFVNGLPKVFCDDVLHLVVVHEFLEEFLVLVSSIDHQSGEPFVELEGDPRITVTPSVSSLMSEPPAMRIDHIGIAVDAIDEAEGQLLAFGAEKVHEEVTDQKFT